ncbi:hypothetical protein MRX96_039263 [Rhipicephalus microplus]
MHLGNRVLVYSNLAPICWGHVVHHYGEAQQPSQLERRTADPDRNPGTESSPISSLLFAGCSRCRVFGNVGVGSKRWPNAWAAYWSAVHRR